MVGCKASVAVAHRWSRLPSALTVHSSCTTSIAAEQRLLAARTDRGHRQRCREGAAGGRDGEERGCLVRRASASLQGTPQRRRWALAARMLHRACCALPASFCSQLPRLTLCSVLRRLVFVCLFLCFFVSLFVSLRLARANHPVDGTAYAARASSRGNGLFAVGCAGVRRRCARTGAPPQPHRAIATQRHCASAYA